MDLLGKIREDSQRHHRDTIAARRHLHAHPELSFAEHETASWIEARLSAMGLKPQRIAGTGVVAFIKGTVGDQGKVVALRADMDALPIQEKGDHPYRSVNPGIMHACGHDVHTASLLSTARILNECKDHFPGVVKLIFQPGEEKNPGGASLMIRDGVLDNPRPDVIIGQHVMPVMPVGTVGFREGKYMASSDEIRLTVIGKGGHASTPDLNIDPVLIASHIIVGLQQVISRNASPKQPTVLSFGRIEANGATNVVPDKVEIAGTFRALDEQWRQRGLDQIVKMASGIAESMGGKCVVDISKGYPCLINDAGLTRRIRACAEQYLGAGKVEDIDLTLGSEDFAWYSQQIPASFYRLGTRNELRGITSYVHTPTFDIDEDALAIGPGLMAWMAVNELQIQNR